MPSPSPVLPTTRREFLRLSGRGIGLLAFSRFAPSFLVNSTRAAAPAPEKDRTILVLVQLAGGNDGLNTLVPFEDGNYYRLRPSLAIAKSQVLRLTDMAGLHPACGALRGLLNDGRLAIIQNVGYPNPNRSHFRSTEIWETASPSNEFLPTGWVGRFFDNTCCGVPADAHDPVGLHVTEGMPQSFLGAGEHPTFGLSPYARSHRENEENRRLLESFAHGSANRAPSANETFLEHTLMDALVTEQKVQTVLAGYHPAPESNYPQSLFSNSLRDIAALIAARLPTRVYFTSLSGFDTHGNQASQHTRLLGELSDGLAAFQRDLAAHHLDDQVLTMTFSEFGRRPSENVSHGTDHGTAAPLFVMGSRVRAGVHGTAPSLNLAPNQDLTFSTDFRRVYATMLDRWLACDSRAVLQDSFAPLDFV
ncbi:MAG TPA: DUF1501 domain-containing protein [Opitutus sp.]|nr:DUF1501 domain-containing protein [Opitutus sp.]